MIHSFDIEIAEKYGIPEAIILHNISFWIDKNRANGKNEHEGYYWTYNSIKAFKELFPYMKENTIRRVLEKLEKLGVIKTGNFNNIAYDRTKWYTIVDKWTCKKLQIHLRKNTNGIIEKHKSIPDNKPIINTYTYRVDEIHTRIEKFKQRVYELNTLDTVEKEKFVDYWTEKSPAGRKMRFEKEKVFDIARRMRTWKSRIKSNYSPIQGDLC